MVNKITSAHDAAGRIRNDADLELQEQNVVLTESAPGVTIERDITPTMGCMPTIANPKLMDASLYASNSFQA